MPKKFNSLNITKKQYIRNEDQMTDKKIAEFVGVTPKTLQNWKKPIKQEEPDGDTVLYYPPIGKNRLYQGAKLATHLLSYREEDHFNELEHLSSKADSIVSLLSLLDREDVDDSIKRDMMKQIKREATGLKKGFAEIGDLVSL